MTVILQGSLRHFPPWQLLPFLACSVDLAVLQVEGSAPARLWLRGGRAVWGESPGGNDVVAATAAMMNAGGGMFMVSDSVDVPDGAQTVEMEIGELLEEAGKVAHQTAALLGDHVTFRVMDDPSLHESISLTADEFRLVFKIGSGRTVGDLLKGSAQSREELTRVLQNLQEHGLIVRDEGGLSPDTAQTKIEPAPPRPATLPKTTRPKKVKGSLTADAPDGSVFPLIDDEYTIGRESTNTIVLKDGSISAKHAVVTRTGEGWTILDLASRNGTFVNGEPVKDRRLLNDNDIVRLGKLILTFNIAGEIKPGDTTETPAAGS